MTKFKAGWYVMYTKPRHEKAVARRLNELNINGYLPITKTLRTWCDRKRFIEMPLFPSYVFVQLQNMLEYSNGLDIEGALHYVRFGKEVVTVSESIIHNIQMVVEQGKDIEVSAEYFKPGQQLSIQRGPLTGLSCEMVRVDGRQKILVRVNLLQRNLLMTMPAEDLLAISA
jgi:transcriptional antiterminator RfaH